MKIQVGEVKFLLESGKTVKVKTLNNTFTKIVNYIDKGLLNTYSVTLENGLNIKVSKEHKFFTNCGWIECQNLLPRSMSIMCDDGAYHMIESIEYIGKYKIVDIEVEHPEHCYYGNSMLNHNTGKSLIAAQVLAEAQKKGGLAVFIDTESSSSPEFMQAIGVNISQMLYVQLGTIEKIFQAIENIITSVRNSNRDRLVAIVVDSLAAASTDVEMEADYSKDGYATTKAILLSKALRKITNLIAKQRILVIFTNQLRMKMQAMAFASPYTTPGGKALGFHASVRLQTYSVGKIKDKNDVVIGNKMKVEVIKNKVGPPFRKAEFEMYYDSGLDNYSGWIKVLKEHDIIKQSGSSYSFELPGKEAEKFMAKDFREILESRPEVHDFLYSRLCELLIMKYKKPGEIRIDDELSVDEKDTSGMEL